MQAVSASAYVAAYLPVIGAVPKPATESYDARIDRNEVWVARDPNTGAAVGVLVLDPRPDRLLIYSIAVDPARQRLGCATALLARAERVARDLGYGTVGLFTNRRMVGNLELYRRNGYVMTGERAHPSRAGEFLVDMAKRLR